MQAVTRDNSGVEGKQNVCFCAHPRDVEQYRQSLCDDIFQFLNCAIWYDDTDQPEEADAAFYQKMDLAVIPVTPNLLYEDSYAKRVQIPLLKRLHIPILPVLTDNILHEDANRLFDNAQMLDRCSNDITALGYYDKLYRYLQLILIHEELRDRIQNAFHRSIFLSYRKKDRQLALELMAKIHAHKPLRKTGIWYDEFLVPGEDFNDGIRAAIARCDAVTLMLTPNTLEKDNYILLHEYPFARKQSKPVIPVVMADTDLFEARSHFPGTQPPLDIQDPAFHKKLEQMLAFEQTQQDSPENDYLIGCAYLFGIQVERNFDYAVSLIENAAEHGWKEAAYQLAILYRTGSGVEQSLEKQEHWLVKYLDLCAVEYSKTKSVQDGRTFIDGLLFYAGFLFEQKRFDEGNEYFEDALNFALDQKDRKAYLPSICDICAEYGAASLQCNELKRAHRLFVQALAIHQELLEADPAYGVSKMHDIALQQYHLGTVSAKLGKEEQATKYLASAVHNYEILAKRSPEKYSLYLAESLGNLAIACRELWVNTDNRKYFQAAEYYLKRSLEVANSRIDADPGVYEPIFARSCNAAAQLYFFDKDHDRSAYFYEVALKYFRAFVQMYPGQYEYEYAQILVGNATLHRIMKKHPQALESLNAAEPIIEAMYRQYPQHFDLEYAKVQMVKGITLMESGQLSDSAAALRTALDIYESTERAKAEFSHEFADCCSCYADVCTITEDLDTAKQYTGKALELYESMPEKRELFQWIIQKLRTDLENFNKA